MECVGCADRSAYDLNQHMMATGVKLVAEKRLPEPKSVDVTEIITNKQTLGKTFKKDAKTISEALAKLSISEIDEVKQKLESNKYLHLNFRFYSNNLNCLLLVNMI